MTSSLLNIHHLYWRAGFGPPLDLASGNLIENEVEAIFQKSKKFVPLTLTGWNPVTHRETKTFDDVQKKAYNKMEKEAKLQIVNKIFERQIHAEFFLREK
ncbi:MAG: hypothetical protein IPP71_05770 [Bacteroidetes bacterium]|nr:hypothetical protein [Bacteroidota bacterium]